MKIDELVAGVLFESETNEFKKNLNKNEDKRWIKTICGFANSKGGHMYIGVDDITKIVNPFEDKEIDKLKMLINDSIFSNISPIPKYEISLVKVGNKHIIDLIIYKNGIGITFFKNKDSGNQIYIRRDGQTNFATTEEIVKLALSSKKYEYDKTHIGLKRKDVSFTELEEEYRKSNNNEALTDKILKSMELITDEGYLTIAGLLFSDNNQYNNANITCTTWPGESKGTREYTDSKAHKGSVLSLLKSSIEYIHSVTYYMFGGMKTDSRRLDTGSFSDLSLREAIVNAIAHRDYMIDGNEISIDCFKDRIEITSPGSMLQGNQIGFRRLDETTISQRRNAVTCRVFEKLKLMENKGSGFARIVSDYMGLNDSYAPLFKTNDVSFTIRLANKKFISSSQNKTTPITTSKNYLDHINLFKSRTDLFKENKKNELIINLIESDKNADYNAIAELLDITKDGAKYYIKKLREGSLIRREGSARSGHYEVYNELDRPADFMNLDDEVKQRVVFWCKKYFIESKSFNLNRDSHDLKHVFEKDTETYLTNGQFKGAMLIAGFKPKNIDELNWNFNISSKSPALHMTKKA
jgi:ATP-dependent DNA helicase RecG